MNMTILQRAVLALVKEVAKDKKNRNVIPSDVTRLEINKTLSITLEQLTQIGVLKHRLLSINKIDAYSVSETSN